MSKENNDGEEGDGVRSIVAASIKEHVDEEKCVVAQYRTTTKQKNDFMAHLSTCQKNSIPIEWVIDIADESNGWFYGTAYHFDDSAQMLHVMVPDKQNPSFEGKVLLDHRTVHLIECVDGKSDALFNKIVRDSVIKVKWEVEWFEEEENGAIHQDTAAEGAVAGKWIKSSARYFIRIANQLLVEDKDFGQDTRGFVILTADLNLRFLHCHKNRGTEDFVRLIQEGIVQSSPEATEQARIAALQPPETIGENTPGDRRSRQSHASANEPDAPNPVQRIAELTRNLKECLADILDDREKTKDDSTQIANSFSNFALNGDLDEGLRLIDHFNEVKSRGAAADAHRSKAHHVNEEKIDTFLDEAWSMMQRLDRNVTKLETIGGSGGASDDVERLQKQLRKLTKDLEERDRELQQLRATK